ncbi:GNAT family N-acetyltransferase [Halorubrum ejinorense]|uniref:GNAT family N-acetyltransferase n=1 Tax=Halorubrum ejinorense TaxID=425309 RepID=A0AAV3SS05_9EURY
MEVRRPTDETDIEESIRVHGLAWRAAYDEILPEAVLDETTVDPTPEDVRSWTDRLDDGDRGVVFVAVDDGVVCGFVDVRWGAENTKPFVGADEAGVKAIYVRPDRWGEGIGSALLDRAIDAVPDRVEAVRLEAFAENDVGARF